MPEFKVIAQMCGKRVILVDRLPILEYGVDFQKPTVRRVLTDTQVAGNMQWLTEDQLLEVIDAINNIPTTSDDN